MFVLLQYPSSSISQAVCSDIFLRHQAYPGLLRNPPADISEDITGLLDKCVQPPAPEQVQESSTTNTFQALHRLLKESLKGKSQIDFSEYWGWFFYKRWWIVSSSFDVKS